MEHIKSSFVGGRIIKQSKMCIWKGRGGFQLVYFDHCGWIFHQWNII